MGSVSEAIGISMPLALAIAASPGAIIAMIFMLLTRKAMINSFSFLAGWFIGLLLVGMIFLHRPALYDSSGEPSNLLGWVRIILGSVIFITGLFMLKRILVAEVQEAPPHWFHRVDSYGFFHAWMIGFFFAVPNIKNASMVTTGAASIGSFGLGNSPEIMVLILFCMVASLGVLAPPVIFLLFRCRAEVIFGKLKRWLIRYRAPVLFAVCIIFGGLFLYQGIRIVSSFYPE